MGGEGGGGGAGGRAGATTARQAPGKNGRFEEESEEDGRCSSLLNELQRSVRQGFFSTVFDCFSLGLVFFELFGLLQDPISISIWIWDCFWSLLSSLVSESPPRSAAAYRPYTATESYRTDCGYTRGQIQT